MRIFNLRQLLVFIAVLFAISISLDIHAQTIIYVKPVASGTGNGSSWANASSNLKSIIDGAAPNTQIWVAAGTYKPTNGTDRSISFSLKNQVALYGGFNGTETQLGQRDVGANISILSGDIGTLDDLLDNSYHVIKNNGIDNSAILDGFTINYGYANGTDFDGAGGGILNTAASPIITNSIISSNYAIGGGGMYMQTNSAPKISSCIIAACSTSGNGGGVLIDVSSSAEFTNCIIAGNTANNGGALNNSGDGAILTNCLLTGNKARSAGGGIYNVFNGQVTLTNCTIASNSHATTGGGIYNNASFMNLKNCIVWGNTSGIEYSVILPIAENSIVQGGTGYQGTNVFDMDPLFVDQLPIFPSAAIGGDFQLQTCSPAIDAGTSVGAPSQDILSQPRPALEGYDMGAYELQSGECLDYASISRIYVKGNAFGSNIGTTWVNAFNNLQDALAIASSYSNITEIWVAGGIYYPTSTGDRSITFSLRNNLAIYGGFAGGELSLNDRNIEVYTTTLLGNIGNFTSRTDNSYHVVSAISVNNTAVLDGFRIAGGYASIGGNDSGGGMYISSASPTISNCTFALNYASNSGGAIYASQSSPIITDCVFNSNTSGGSGGAIRNTNNSNGIFTKCVFTENQATTFGGAIFNTMSSPIIQNSRFSGNNSNQQGGAMHSDNLSSPMVTNTSFTGNNAGLVGGAIMTSSSQGGTFINCTITGNSAGTSGGAMYSFNGASVNYKNCIIWNNRAAGQTNTIAATNVLDGGTANFEYCIVANSGGSGGWQNTIGVNNGNNMDQDPRFLQDVDLGTVPNSSGNIRLLPCSPAINAGDNTSNSTTLDLDNNPRKFNTIDKGAYEYQSAPGPCCPAGNILYVKQNATGLNDGSSWANAYTSLHAALSNTCSGITQIWVAGGFYYPTSTTNRNISFNLRNNLGIYGGFGGTESSLGERNIAANTTNLTGNIGNFAINTDNSTHVINAVSVNNTAILDGFRIGSGYASASGNDNGGGMYISSASPTIRNCTFVLNFAGNSGGAVYSTNSSPHFTDCIFIQNTSGGSGGAIRNTSNSSGIFTRCVFTENQAATFGGAIFNTISLPIIQNSRFSGNNSNQQGGAMHSDNLSSPMVTNTSFTGNNAGQAGGAIMTSSSQGGTFTNCTITGNSAGTSGGAMYSFNGASVNFKNCIIWNNRAAGLTNTSSATNVLDAGTANFEYCIVANSGGSGSWKNTIGVNDGNNMDVDPLFLQDVDLSTVPNRSGNISLQPCSAAVNGGFNAFNGSIYDLDGNVRLFGVIDLGAYELQENPPSVLYVDLGAGGNNTGSSWENAFTTLDQALEILSSCGSTKTMMIAEGTYTTAGDFIVDRQDAIILAGYPNGGGMIRDPETYRVILEGDLHILQSAQMDGIILQK